MSTTWSFVRKRVRGIWAIADLRNKTLIFSMTCGEHPGCSDLAMQHRGSCEDLVGL